MNLRGLKVLSFTLGMILTSNTLVGRQGQSPEPKTAKIPLSYGLVVDASGSLRLLLPAILDTSKTIVSSNEPNDETFIVRFISSDKIDRVQDLTQRKELLNDAVDNIYVEGGLTAIIDALYKSAQYLAQEGKSDAIPRGQALILISDGEDRASRQSLKTLLELTKAKKIKVYVIGVVAELEKDKGKRASAKAVAFLSNLAKETGGTAFFPRNLLELRKSAEGMLSTIRRDF